MLLLRSACATVPWAPVNLETLLPKTPKSLLRNSRQLVRCPAMAAVPRTLPGSMAAPRPRAQAGYLHR